MRDRTLTVAAVLKTMNMIKAMTGMGTVSASGSHGSMRLPFQTKAGTKLGQPYRKESLSIGAD